MREPTPNQIWAAITLCRTPDVCRSVLAGFPVLVDHLDRRRLYHAVRGAPQPPPGQYRIITGGMLDAINEAGPLEEPKPRRRAA